MRNNVTDGIFAPAGRELRAVVWYAPMNTIPTISDADREPATRPRASLGVRFLGWFLLSSSLGLVSCQSLFFM